jgi:hypothetical protein
MDGGDLNLYSPSKTKPKAITGFANKGIAEQTLENIKLFSLPYQKQVVITMYNRAKYHPHKTSDMKEAMKVFSNWMKLNYISTRTKKKSKPKYRKTYRKTFSK